MSKRVTVELAAQACADLEAIRPILSAKWAKAPYPRHEPTDAEIVATALHVMLSDITQEVEATAAGQLANARPAGTA